METHLEPKHPFKKEIFFQIGMAT